MTDISPTSTRAASRRAGRDRAGRVEDPGPRCRAATTGPSGRHCCPPHRVPAVASGEAGRRVLRPPRRGRPPLEPVPGPRRHLVGVGGGGDEHERGRRPVGQFPEDSANSHAIGIEANGGHGEPWPAVQTDSYQAGVAALCRRLQRSPRCSPISSGHRRARSTRPARPRGPPATIRGIWTGSGPTSRQRPATEPEPDDVCHASSPLRTVERVVDR